MARASPSRGRALIPRSRARVLRRTPPGTGRALAPAAGGGPGVDIGSPAEYGGVTGKAGRLSGQGRIGARRRGMIGSREAGAWNTHSGTWSSRGVA